MTTEKKDPPPPEDGVYPIERGGRYDGKPGFCRQVPECGCGCHPAGPGWNNGVYYGDWKP